MHVSERIGCRIKLQDLNVLMTVVQTGSMGKAAQRLNRTQPNVSRSIAELEHALGVRLLDRRRGGIAANQYGRALLDCGLAVFDDLRQGVKTIKFLADPTAGEVRIGCNPFLAASYVSAIVDQLTRRYPRIVFHLVATETDALHRELHERNIDFLVTWRLGPLADERLTFEPLFDDSYLVVAGAQNPWARRRKISLADLIQEPWTLPPPESVLGTVFRDAFHAGGLEYPRASVFAVPLEVRISLLATGRFLTIFPSSVLRFLNRHIEIKALPIELPIPHVPTGIVTLKDRTLSPIARMFIEHAREVAKPLAKNR